MKFKLSSANDLKLSSKLLEAWIQQGCSL